MSFHDSCRRHCDKRSLSRSVRHASWYVIYSYPPEYALTETLLGTSIICAFLEIFMSFVPPRVLQKIFPPLVTGMSIQMYIWSVFVFISKGKGTVILMIGASLIGSSGIPDWGGGSNDCAGRPTSGIFELCPTIFAPRPLPCVVPPMFYNFTADSWRRNLTDGAPQNSLDSGSSPSSL